MDWFTIGNCVCWQEDGERVYGRIVGLDGLLGWRGYEKGWVMMKVEVLAGTGWWSKFEIGFERSVVLEKGKFEVLDKNGHWRRVK